MLPPLNGVPVGPGRVFSVWDWDRMRYTYYRAVTVPGDQGGWTYKAPAAVGVGGRGVSVEAVLRALPPDAKPFGTGDRAKGEIAVVHGRATQGPWRGRPLPEGLSGVEPDLRPAKTGAMFLLGALAVAVISVKVAVGD